MAMNMFAWNACTTYTCNFGLPVWQAIILRVYPFSHGLCFYLWKWAGWFITMPITAKVLDVLYILNRHSHLEDTHVQPPTQPIKIPMDLQKLAYILSIQFVNMWANTICVLGREDEFKAYSLHCQEWMTFLHSLSYALDSESVVCNWASQ